MQVTKLDIEPTFTILERISIGCLLQGIISQLAIVQTGNSTFRPKKSRYFNESILETLWTEILTRGTMDSIQEALLHNRSCMDEEMEHVETSNNYNKQVDDTETQIKQLMIRYSEKIIEKEIQLAILQDELLDLQYHKEVSLAFTNKRIGCKLSQVSLCLHEHQQFLSQLTDMNVLACDLQDRVHVEILNYLDSVIENLKEQLGYWCERNKSEMAEINSKLARLQQDRSKQSLQLQALKTLFQKHNEDIRLYVEERTERERKERLQQHVNDMATRIQAWWRGTMVRRHLGPYKADKKKKPKDKTKKQK